MVVSEGQVIVVVVPRGKGGSTIVHDGMHATSLEPPTDQIDGGKYTMSLP